MEFEFDPQKSFGFDCTFEARVAAGISGFYLAFNPDQERLWLLETESQITGSIGIVRRSESEAQLRWFLVHPVHRGQGFGKLLLNEAINFCKDNKYRTISLSTFSELTKAGKLYQNAGFQIAEVKTQQIWGKTLIEQKYVLNL